MTGRRVVDTAKQAFGVNGLALGVVVLLVLGSLSSTCQGGHGSPRVEIWTDRGAGGVYRVGECVEIRMRSAYDCYVMVYEIDTDGYLRVLFPSDCDDDGYVLAGRTYCLGRGGYRSHYVNGPTGVGYVHVLASWRPFRRIYWEGCRGWRDYGYEVAWHGFHDYWGCALPPRVYGDPYVAMQTIDEFICEDDLELGIVRADFTYFYVGDRVHYPRYLCYDCHGFGGHVRPYVDVCVGFSIHFIDCNPCYRPCSWWWWCSPVRTYCGPRYVCHNKKHCDAYPSEYKWKSRHEAGRGSGADEGIVGGDGRKVVRLNDGAVRREDDSRRRPEVEDGNTRVDARVKAKEDHSERDLYSRRGSGSESRGEVKVEKDEMRDGDRRAEPRRDTKVERSRPSGSPVGRGVLSKLISVIRSRPETQASRASRIKGSGDQSSRKVSTPQVRGADKGKSRDQSTRRSVSSRHKRN